MRRLMLFSALPLLAGLFPVPSAALCPCTGAIIDHAADSASDRAANADRIIDAIRASAGQTSAYIDKSAAAAEKIQDASDLNAGLRVRDGMRAAAEGGRYDPAATACGGLSAARALAAPAGQSSDSAPPPATGGDTQNSSRNYERCADGADEVCGGPGAVSAGIIADRDAARGTGGVLDPTSDLRVLLQQPTAGAGTDTQGAKLDRGIWRLTQNIVNPFPDRPVTEAEASTPGGRIEIAERQSASARRSAAAALLGWIQTRSAPALPLGEWAERTAPPGYSYPIGDRISVRQYYDVAVASAFRNPEWHKRVMAMSPEAAARELALQTALANDLSLLRFELDLHRAAVDAVIAARLLDEG